MQLRGRDDEGYGGEVNLNITMPARRLSETITATVTVTGTRTFNARCAIGMRMLKLAAWVFPFGVKVEVKL